MFVCFFLGIFLPMLKLHLQLQVLHLFVVYLGCFETAIQPAMSKQKKKIRKRVRNKHPFV